MQSLLNFTVDMTNFDPEKEYLHEFQTENEFETDYYGEDYNEPWVSAIHEEDDEVAFNKRTVTSITLTSLVWVTDVPADGGTATKDNCAYTVIGHRMGGIDSDITRMCVVTGSLNVQSSQNLDRHTAGTLQLTFTYGQLSVTGEVAAYQEAYVPVIVLTAITIDNLTWVTDIPATGGTATKDNCVYFVTAHYSDSTSGDVTSLATVTGSLAVPASQLEDLHTAGTLTLTATYSGLSTTGDVIVYQEGTVIDYSTRYLTLDVISGGTIGWKSVGNTPKTISYSLDSGAT